MSKVKIEMATKTIVCDESDFNLVLRLARERLTLHKIKLWEKGFTDRQIEEMTGCGKANELIDKFL